MLAALAEGGAMATPAHAAQSAPAPYSGDGDGGTWNSVLVTLERIATTVLLLAIVGLVGAILAAELSASANAAIKTIIHVDIREAMTNFWSWLQMLWHRYHKQS
jgi:hypothetical protein